jgi:hypothetical protein
MNSHRIAAVILSSMLAMACGGNATDHVPSNPETTAPAAAPAPQSPAHESSPVRSAAVKPAKGQNRSAAAATAAREVPLAAPPKPRFRDVSAPAGSELRLELTTALSTETAEIETPVSARLKGPVVVDGVTVLPADAVFHGHVTEADRPGRVRGRAHLAFRFTEVEIGKQRDPVRTHSVSFDGDATKSEDAVKVGAGAGIGAAIGAIVGGGSGAAKGAAIGGAAGAGTVLATRGRDVVLPVGSDVNATLASPYEMRVEIQ